MPAWLVIISVIVYLYLSHRLIQRFYDRLRPILMDRPRFAFRQLDRIPLTGASDAKEKGRRLKEAVAAGRLYDDPDLTLAVLAVKPAIPPHDLSRIINQGLFGDEPLVGKFCLPDCCFVVDDGGGLTSPVKSLRSE